MEDLKQNLINIRARILAACQSCKRDPNTVQLLPVSKNHSSKTIQQLHQLGLTHFGENYAQEMLLKAAELENSNIDWVFIGQLQTNKIKKIVACAQEIQSVTSFKHAQMVARCAEEIGKSQYPIFLNVNAGNEESKGGIPTDEVLGLAARIHRELPGLRIRGLMAIPPESATINCNPDEIPRLYQDLASIARSIGEGGLSLGMSADLEFAIRAGSTCVRVGTALLGRRGTETI